MKKLLVVFLFLGLLLPMSFLLAQQSALDSDAKSLIKTLQDQIKNLQTQVTDLQSQLEVVKIELKFTHTLARGTKGDDVKQLQEFLKTMPDIYPEGKVTGYFGPLTEAAIKRFQEKQGIESVGFVGPRTIAKLNEVVGTVPATPAQPVQSPQSDQSALFQLNTTPAPQIPQTPSALRVVSSEATNPLTVNTNGVPAATSAPVPAVPASPTTPTTPAAPTVSITPTPTPSDTTPPSTPTGLTATAVLSRRIDLSWTASTDNVGVVGYKIYNSGPNGTIAFNYGPITIANFYNYGLDYPILPETTYGYTVAAFDAVGNMSPQSNSISVTTPPSLLVISSLTATDITDHSAKITWTTDVPSNSQAFWGTDLTISNASDFQYYSQVPSSCDSSKLVTSHCVNITGLTKSTLYHYMVRSSAESSSVSVSSGVQGFPTTSGDTSSILLKNNLASILDSLKSILAKLQQLVAK